jgi:hypothetical protein
MKQKPIDPVIDEVRAIRHSISARFQHDPEKLVAHYRNLHQQYQNRLVKSKEISESASGA